MEKIYLPKYLNTCLLVIRKNKSIKKLFLTTFIFLFLGSFLYSQSIYLEKERFAIAVNQSATVVENGSILSVGSSFSFKKKVDVALQYSSISNKDEDSGQTINGNGISGSINFWAKKTDNDLPLDIALTILGSYANYPDFDISSFGAGIIVGYKKEQPTSFEVVPLVGVSFIPFSQISSGSSSRVANDQFFSFQFGIGLYTSVVKQSKFVIEPSFSFDTSSNVGASISASFIF